MNFRIILNIFAIFFVLNLPCSAAAEVFRARLSFQPQRTIFVRGEQNRFITWRLKCKSEQMSGQKAVISWENVVKDEIALPAMKKNQYAPVECPVPTYLREGTYKVKISCGNQVKEKIITILPRFNPEEMPVVMWGIYGQSTPEKRKVLKDIGFTHFLNHGNVNCSRLDEVLAAGLRILCLSAFANTIEKNNDKMFQITGKNGNKMPGTLFALSPKVQTICKSKASVWAKTYAQFATWSGCNINSEIRDKAKLDFSEYSRRILKQDCGIDIPVKAKDKKGIDYKTIKEFPADGIISDKDPTYLYYKWFWERGDGWNQLNTIVNNAIKTCGRKDIWTFYDPAARCLAVYGSGGDVDVLSQWNYTYPNPIRAGFSTDESLCLAKGAKTPQSVMAMTQVICYRDRLAPKSIKPIGEPPAWSKKEAQASFLTIPPDLLSIAFWSEISRPVTGIMYHGWPSLTGYYRTWSDKTKKEHYRYTNTTTREVLKKLVNEVVVPLGPTFKKVPDRSADIAFLESFSSQIFTRNSRSLTAHKDGWSNNAYLILQYAHLQPEIVFEDAIRKNGLSKYKILVMVDCQVLPQSVYSEIRKFQQAGGIIIGDEKLTSAITPDISIGSYLLTKNPLTDKNELLKRAEKIRKELGLCYVPYIDSNDHNIIVRARKYLSSDYLFVVNDNRTYGNYVGQFRRCMEKGIPVSGKITVQNKNNCLYNLVTHKKVGVANEKNGISFNLELKGAEGQAYLLLPYPIDSLKINMPQSIAAGGNVGIKISVLDSRKLPVEAIIPIKVEISNPAGHTVEGTGHYAAVNGMLTVNFASAINDKLGKWKVSVTELASGLQETRFIEILSANSKKINKDLLPVVETTNPTGTTQTDDSAVRSLTEKLSLKQYTDMLESPQPLARRRAVRALGGFGKTALPSIQKAMANNDSGVRRIALDIFVKHGALTQDILTKALMDSSSEVQLAAVKFIERSGDTEQRKLLQIAMKSKFPPVRENASEALLPLGKATWSARSDADFAFVKVKSTKFPLKGWKFKLDPDNKGHIEKWFEKTEFADWDKIEIGNSWENAGYDYDGIAWYAFDFILSKDKHAVVELNFSAIDESAWIWLNGEYAGKHDIGPSGWKKSFVIDISNAIKYDSKNTLVVRVKDTANAGGIWKPVNIDFYDKGH